MCTISPSPSTGRRLGDADLLLDPLGGRLADQQIVVAADVGGDRLVHLVAADPDRGGVGEAAQREHGDLGGAAADVDDHRSDRLGHRHVGADRGGHRLLDQPDLAGAGIGGGVADRAALDRGGARRHADHDLGPAREAALAVDLVDEVLDHLLGDVDVGDDAVAQGPDRLDLVRGLAHHQLGVVADRLHPLDAVDRLDRDHRRLVEDDAAAADVDDRVRGTEIDRHVVGGKSQEIENAHIQTSSLQRAVVGISRPAQGNAYRMGPRPRSTKE
jgi:hypothetical protein